MTREKLRKKLKRYAPKMRKRANRIKVSVIGVPHKGERKIQREGLCISVGPLMCATRPVLMHVDANETQWTFSVSVRTGTMNQRI